jgi:hypothetical protein
MGKGNYIILDNAGGLIWEGENFPCPQELEIKLEMAMKIFIGQNLDYWSEFSSHAAREYFKALN